MGPAELQPAAQWSRRRGAIEDDMLDIHFGHASDPGKIRTRNEDRAGCFVPATRREAGARGWLFALADGVGGMQYGDVASAAAVRAVTEEFAACAPGVPLRDVALRLMQCAHEAVWDTRGQPEYMGAQMATTLVLCAIRGDQAVVAHVGDSRCYHLRGGHARQVTEDHTVATQQHRMGIAEAAENEESAVKHILTMSVGTEAPITPDTTAFSVEPGDVLVLCTDGVHNGIGASEMAKVVWQKRKPVNEMALELVMRAVEVDGTDNATAQVIQIRSVERVGKYRGRQYRVPA